GDRVCRLPVPALSDRLPYPGAPGGGASRASTTGLYGLPPQLQWHLPPRGRGRLLCESAGPVLALSRPGVRQPKPAESGIASRVRPSVGAGPARLRNLSDERRGTPVRPELRATGVETGAAGDTGHFHQWPALSGP